MSFKNKHSDYIDARIADVRKLDKWNTKICETSHEDFIKDFVTNVFTNLIQYIFRPAYLKKHPCSDCNKPSEHRCHGKKEDNEDRGSLIKKALEKVYPDTTKIIRLKDIIIQFLEEHKTTKFTFKCKPCHLKENESSNIIKVFRKKIIK